MARFPHWLLRDPVSLATEDPGLQSPVSTEYHYYLGGRASGVLAWLAIAKLIQVIFW